MIDPKLLEILGNPLEPDRPPLREERGYLVCTKTGVGFPIEDGIPQLLPENAIPAETLKRLLDEHN
jgi:uncharacterized protein YbaR (Trm112 family)